MIRAVQQYFSTEMPFLLSLSVMSDSMIMDAIASFLVLPNRLVVPLVPGLHVAQLRSPLPRVTSEYVPTDGGRLLYNVTSQSTPVYYILVPLFLS